MGQLEHDVQEIQKKNEMYWLTQLGGEIVRSTLPRDCFGRTEGVSGREQVPICLDAETSLKALQLSNNNDSLLFTILMTVLKICISRYTGVKEVSIGTTIHRLNSDSKVVNKIVVIRDELDPEFSFKELLLQVKTTITEAYVHQNYPFKQLINLLGIELEKDHSPIFDIALILKNIHDMENLFDLNNDLTVCFEKRDDQLMGWIEYKALYYHRETVEQFGRYFTRVLQIVLEDVNVKIHSIDFLTMEEKERYLYTFNQTKQEYPQKTVSQLFEEQVEKTPDRRALVFGDLELTYRQLNERANCLAWALQQNGVRPDTITGIMLPRSFEMVVAVLAVLKAGGAYLPIDPEYPEERIQYMLTQSKVKLVLTDGTIHRGADLCQYLDLTDAGLFTDQRGNLPFLNHLNDLAYVIYTSGSTGLPKGVMVEHRGLVNYINWASRVYLPKNQGNFPLYSSLSFDLTVTSLYVPLITGNTIYIYGENEQELAIQQVMLDDQVDLIKLTPAHLQCIRSLAKIPQKLKVMIVGGEMLKTELARTISEKFHHQVAIYNEYGPTETVVGCMIYRFDPVTDAGLSVPIGKPADNTQIYLLDAFLQPVGMGVEGELYISGDGVARGYLDLPEITAERFIPNPFIPHQKMYKTGDRGRRLFDHNLEFLGRKDSQVKIRGYRIELSEIEHQLLNLPEIKEAVVIVHEDCDDPYLSAYVVTDAEITETFLRSELSRRIPEYMIPAQFIVIDAIPLTPNGKVDQNELIKEAAKRRKNRYVPPRTPMEKKLVAILSDVLRKDDIGIYDNFLEIGGHSLKAMEVSARIYSDLKIEFSIMEIFAHNTVKDLAKVLSEREESEYIAIEPVAEQEYYPVSSAQKRLYVLHQLDKHSLSYNLPYVWIVEGMLYHDKLEQAFQQLIERHEILRTTFTVVNGQTVQQVHSEVNFPLQHCVAREDELEEIVNRQIQPFNLKQAPLIRAAIVTYEAQHLLILDMHHIVSDAISQQIFFTELIQLYQGEELPPQRLQYKDFAVWQHDFLRSEKVNQQETYWLNQFSGEIPVLNLYTDHPRPSVISFEGDRVHRFIEAEKSQKIKELALQNDATLFMVYLAAYYILLAKYSGQDDMIIGTPIAGRPHADLETIMGMFSNTLALRNRPHGEKTFTEFLSEVKDNALTAYQNQDYQFEMLVEKLDLERDTSRNPLFDTVFVLQNMDKPETSLVDLRIYPFPYQFKIAKFDLRLAVSETPTGMGCDLEYNTQLYEKETVERILSHYDMILTEVLKNPDGKLSAIQVLTASEKEEFIYGLNQTECCYPNDQTIHQLFFEQVKKVPGKAAVIAGQQTLTYLELNEHAEKLARVLRQKGVKRNQFVGLLSQGSVESIIGILGILKAGGAYLPIDPEYPQSRIQFMIHDSGMEICLAQRKWINQIGFSGEWILLDDEFCDLESDCLKNQSAEIHLEMVNTADDLAYVIYTSGSTGNPKGVMIRHQGLVNYAVWASQVYLSDGQGDFPLYSSLAFDLTVTSIFVPLITGNAIVVYQNEEKEVLITEVFAEDRVRVVKLTPAHLEIIKNLDFAPKNIQTLIVGGENLSTNLAKDIYCKFDKRVNIFNEYGPTETVVGCMIHRFSLEEDKGFAVPIGLPAHNVQIYLLDPYLQPVPIGVPGEIYISGEGVARGYLNREELTREKFIDNPFIPGQKMYQTGDLGRRLATGKLEFIGRMDSQVKIRGYRIELGEIESQVTKLEGVKEAVVIVQNKAGGSKSLLAYLVGSAELNLPEIRKSLEKILPEYMIPEQFIQLVKLPLTNNGKIDYKALPVPGVSSKSTAVFQEPVTEVEKKLAAIWADVLGVEHVSLTDNFFKLAGDSIKAIQILARANQQGINISLKDMFEYKTIAELLRNVDYMQEKKVLSQAEVEGTLPLTPIQEWFFALHLHHPHYYNQTQLFALRADVDLVLLEKVLIRLIEHHDALRIGYILHDGVLEQWNRPAADIDFRLEVIDLSDYDEEEQKQQIEQICIEMQNSINLEMDLLFQSAVFDLGENGLRLFISVHHLVIDGISWRILLEDLQNGYESRLEEDLPRKTTSFKEWSEELLHHSETEKIDLRYWETIHPEEIKSLTEAERGENHSRDHHKLFVQFDKEETTALLTRVNQAYHTTIDDILLSALTSALGQALNTEHVLITLEGHGREEILHNVDISRTVGWFTSEYPVYLTRQSTLEGTIKEVKESLRKIPNKGLNFGIGRYLQQRAGLQGLNPEIAFNYLGQFDSLIGEQTDEKSLLKICSEWPGPNSHIDNQSTHLLEVTGMVIGKKLQVTLDYNCCYLKDELLEEIRDHFQHDLKEIIEHCAQKADVTYTPSDFGLQHHLTVKDFDYLSSRLNLEQVKLYPLTPMQEGMFFHSLLEEENTNYYVQIGFYLTGKLTVEHLKQAWQELSNRHEIFRTSFMWEGITNPIQIIHPELEAGVQEIDLTNLQALEQKSCLETFKTEDLHMGFDFVQGQVKRLSLLKLTEEHYYVCWTFHHIISDGWSSSLAIGELFKLYYCLANDLPLPQAPGAQFSDYLEWIRKQNMAQCQQYWENYLQGYSQPTLLPVDEEACREDVISDVSIFDLVLKEDTSREIAEFCQSLDITMNTFFQTAWGLLLQQYNHTQQSCFGMTVSGRPHELPFVEEIIGIFINTLPVMIAVKEDQSIARLLQTVNHDLIGIREYEYMPLVKAQKLISKTEKVFDSILAFENFPVSQALSQTEIGLQITMDSTYEMSNYDMTVVIVANAEILIRMNYNRNLFSPETLETIATHLMKLIDLFLSEPEMNVREISILTAKEKEELARRTADRCRLNEHEPENQDGSAIETEVERQLRQIWEAVLGVRVGLHDNFYELAGDSIKAIQIMARASQAGIKMRLKDMFQYKTIAQIAKHLAENDQSMDVSQDEVEGEVPLTPIQHWFFEQQFIHPQYYNQTQIFSLPDPVDLNRLEKAFAKLIHHHDALRMFYESADTGIVQYNRSSAEVRFELDYVDLSDGTPERRRDGLRQYSEEYQYKGNLSDGLLIRALIVDLGTEGKWLLIPIHHLVIDRVSWQILLDDLELLYKSNLEAKLPLKSTSFKEWAEKLVEYANSENLDISYWETIQPDTLPSIAAKHTEIRYAKDYQVKFAELDRRETELLLTKVHRAYHTGIDDLLLAALARTVNQVFGISQAWINLEGHGREEIFAQMDLSRTIGWFTAQYPVLLTNQSSLQQLIIHVKENLRQIPNKGLPFGVARYLLQNPRLQELKPEISFNYLGQFDGIINQAGTKAHFLKVCSEEIGPSASLENQVPYLININGAVVDGSLKLSFAYHALSITEEVMIHLSNGFKDSLQQIIAHCMEVDERIYTPSDFALEQYVTVEDFHYLASQYDLQDVKIYPLTPMQEGMLFHSLYNPDARNYYVQLTFTITGKLEMDLLNKAWTTLMQRHQVYRTSFVWEKMQNPLQVIHPAGTGTFNQYDLTELDPQERLSFVSEWKAKDLAKGFDFAKGDLNRFSVLTLDEGRYLICWTFHHILTDGWSSAVSISELLNTYNSLINGLPLPGEPQAQFSDYLDWLRKQDQKGGLHFWQEYLADLQEPTLLGYGSYQKENGSADVAEKDLYFDEEISAKIKTFCRELNITMNVFFQTLWGLLLQKYNRTDQSCAGMTVSGRPHTLPGVEEIVGLFINTVPVVIKQKDAQSWKELMLEVNQSLIEIQQYEYVSLVDIQQLKEFTKLFDSIIVFENYPVRTALQENVKADVTIELESIYERNSFDLTLLILNGDNIKVQFSYNPNTFSPERIERFGVHLSRFVNRVLDSPESLVCEIDLLSVDEKAMILEQFNDTKTEFPPDQTLPQIFAEQVMKTPDNPAVMFENQSLTYAELDHRANQVAGKLREMGVIADTVVAISVQRSLEMAIGIMGILKAGGAYLPVDPTFPIERKQYIFTDSGTKVLLTVDGLGTGIDFAGDTMILDDPAIYSEEGTGIAQTIRSRPENLAYVIYTSGSTGRPKGVMIEHRAIVNRICWMQRQYPLSAEDCIMQKTPYTFDVSVWELVWWFFAGARVVFLTPGGEKDPQTIVNAVEKYQVTIMHFVPSMLNSFLDYLEIHPDLQPLRSLRRVFASGEELKVSQVERFMRRINSVNRTTLHNLYGPTEAAVDVTFYDCLTEVGRIIPIGKPIDHIQLYIVDQAFNLQPIGIPGELCIAGAGLARGYVNNPQLTAEKFVPNPFASGERMYRTGDVARWLPDGNIEFIGRTDFQVKIRGYRIEIGEIEYQVLTHSEIKEAVVIVRTDSSGTKYLCGYIVTDQDISLAELRTYLGERLPEYMIPAYFVKLDKLPLTPNGKIDRNGLPEPDGSMGTGVEYIAPANEVEEKLAQIFSEVLAVKKVGVMDDFFKIGGHSLRAMQLVTKIHSEFNVNIPLRDVFQTSTVKELAQYVKDAEKVAYIPITPVEEREYYPTSSAQKRLYLMRQLGTGIEYNMPGAWSIKDQLDEELLAKAIQTLVQRHESLRTSFAFIDGELIQRIHQDISDALEVVDATTDEIPHILDEFVKPFDLGKPPLFRVQYVKSMAQNLLLLDMHHIISDGLSGDILIREFVALYQGQTLPELSIQYRDYAVWEKETLHSGQLKKQEEYWLAQFAGENPVLNMPADYARTSANSTEGKSTGIVIEEELTAKLKELVVKHDVTLYMVLLAACHILFSKYTGQEETIIGSPVAGRTHADLEKIIGVFINTLAMKNHAQGDKTFAGFLAEVKENALKAYENQEYPFDLLVERLQLQRDSARNPLFDVSLSVQTLQSPPEEPAENLILKPVSLDFTVARFDFRFDITEGNNKIYVGTEYKALLYKEETVNQMLHNYVEILNAIVENSNIKLKEIKLIDELREVEKVKLSDVEFDF